MSKVIIKNCNDYKIENLISIINQGMELEGGWGRFISSGMKVLLKVNLIGPKSSDTAAVTHSEFVRALVRILKNKGCIVWIGDSAGGAIGGVAPTAKSFIVSGLHQVAEEEGAQVKNFDREGVVEVTPESGFGEKMYLAKPLFDADFIINLPKLKTHTAGIYTGAVKNVFGCIPGLKKAEYHKLAPDPKDFGAVLVDIHKSIKIGLHIMDGVTAMCGEGPTAGEVYNAGKILISTDPLALDTISAAMIGIPINDIPILSSAKKSGLGESELKNIIIEGDYGSIPRLENSKLPKRFKSTGKQNYNMLVRVIDFLKTRPRINNKLCKNCNMCVESCPVKAINKQNKSIDYSKCIECMCCHELCMYKAVELKKDNLLAGLMTGLYKGKYR